MQYLFRTTIIFSAALLVACSNPSPKSVSNNTSNTNNTNNQHDVGIDLSSDMASPPAFDPDVLPDCLYEDTDPRVHQILYGTHPTEDVSFILAVCQYAWGVGESSLYRADYFEFTWRGVRTIFPLETIMYDNSHHNWADMLTADFDGLEVTWTALLNQDESRFDHTVTANQADMALPETLMDVTCDNCGSYQFVVTE